MHGIDILFHTQKEIIMKITFNYVHFYLWQNIGKMCEYSVLSKIKIHREAQLKIIKYEVAVI